MEKLFSAGQIARLLRTDARHVTQWMQADLLESGAVTVSKWKQTYLVASKQALVSFLCEHPDLWDPHKCPDLPKQLGYRRPPFWFIDAQRTPRKKKPAKVGPRAAWTEDQDVILATMYVDGKSLKDIAAAMGRTEKAIKRRKEKLGRSLWVIVRQQSRQQNDYTGSTQARGARTP